MAAFGGQGRRGRGGGGAWWGGGFGWVKCRHLATFGGGGRSDMLFFWQLGVMHALSKVGSCPKQGGCVRKEGDLQLEGLGCIDRILRGLIGVLPRAGECLSSGSWG